MLPTGQRRKVAIVKKHTYPSLNRRDLIKVGLFAGASMSLPLSKVVAGQSALDNRMPTSKLPRRSRPRSSIPPVADAGT